MNEKWERISDSASRLKLGHGWQIDVFHRARYCEEWTYIIVHEGGEQITGELFESDYATEVTARRGAERHWKRLCDAMEPVALGGAMRVERVVPDQEVFMSHPEGGVHVIRIHPEVIEARIGRWQMLLNADGPIIMRTWEDAT